jgi:Zn finger protein HypA/HybF involved in hydrogenase expression
MVENRQPFRGSTDMKFIFVCPNQNKVFESADFNIRENRGVITDEAGNKTLDAKVALNEPCPFCGQKHIYHAGELSCPFNELD